MTAMTCGNVIQSKSTYEWSVDKFSERCKTFGECIKSPVFSSGNNNEFSWRLHLYPYGNKEESNGHLSIFLHTENHFDVKVSYDFTIKNVSSLSIKKECEYTFKSSSDGYGFLQYAERNKVVDNIKNLNDVLILTCELHDVTIIQSFYDSQIGNSKFEVLHDIRQLFINQDFCDVTLKTNVKEFRAHKLILSARSKVFAAMFSHDMVEKIKNIVKIEDIDTEVLEAMLKFIYTGELKNVDKITKELSLAADKYAIDGLKNICLTKLYSTINVDNAIDLLQFADLYNFHEFKKSIMDFITTNAKDVIDKPAFQLLKDMPDVLIELYSKHVLLTKT